MTMTEERPPEVRSIPLFGPITMSDMSKDALVAKAAVAKIKEAATHSRGRYTVGNITDGLIAGACDLWGVMRETEGLTAIIVTLPHDGVLDVLLAGPDIDDVVPFLPRLDGIARSARCMKIRMIGPAFWKRQLPKDRWRPASIVYERLLG